MRIEEPQNYRVSFHHRGFRPFFLLAGVIAVVAVATWLWILSYLGRLPNTDLLGLQNWHAHEMLFAYSMAAISGFLLTAEANWTGVQTLHGTPLMILALLWLFARIAPFVPHSQAIVVMAGMDLLFNLGLCLALLHPIIKAKQWKQLVVWLHVLLLFVANAVFYLGIFAVMENGIRLGLYSALYIVISLITLMGRRVIPFFIERGVGYPVTLINRPWLDNSSVGLLPLLLIFDVLFDMPLYAAITAAALAVLHSWRLLGWYTKGIWAKPLLWILYVGYAWLASGFLLKALAYWSTINSMLAVHAFAYGGIGMITLGMMTRISLGHTGRNVFSPPPFLWLFFLLLFVGSLIRVVFPLLLADSYSTWIMLSQWLWIVAFLGFLVLFSPMLIKARVDGKYG
ncbi:MAG: NnrS family protein [Thiohalomonadales bacterium]